jgi:hypothetical protein
MSTMLEPDFIIRAILGGLLFAGVVMFFMAPESRDHEAPVYRRRVVIEDDR